MGGGKQPVAGTFSSSPKGKSVSTQYGQPSGGTVSGNNSPKVDQLSHVVAGISLDSAQDDEWEVCARKSKNRAGTGAAKPWGPQSTGPKAWGQPDTVFKLGLANNSGSGRSPGGAWQIQVADPRKPAGRGNLKANSSNRGWENAYRAPPAVIPPPLQHGRHWANRPGGQPGALEDGRGNDNISKTHTGSAGGEEYGFDTSAHHDDDDDDDDNDNDAVDDDDDDDILSDDYDSDESQKSHETLKKSKWFKVFFDALDKLTDDQINEPTRQWHCPACKDGPGAIDWYRGLQPLITHAKTKGANRVKLHRQLAELLEEELRRRGASVIPAGETFGKWKGLKQTVTDKEIVWPPMVVIMNTKLEQDDNDRWIGMGNQELLDYFSSYAAVKARHSYGPQGHRGMSLLIFESSAVGYVEAERLDDHFLKEGTHRDDWDRRRVLFSAGGKRQLYGFMACKQDLDLFNQHSYGKSMLKFEMRSYQEMVVGPMKQMSEDNQQLLYFKNKVAKEQRRSKFLEESFEVLNEKLRKTTEDNRIVRQRTKEQHEQNKEEMDYQEKFYKDQIGFIQQSIVDREKNFEEQLQEERNKVTQSSANATSKEVQKLRSEEIARFIHAQEKEVEEFEAEREKLIRLHETKKAEMKMRHYAEEIELEKEFETSMTELMSKYTPGHSKEGNDSNAQE
ncbi:protein SUPPRESSOR OF GENE SILENCING 3-like [Macadamia integrifolia]|uniref:protein SUPPRESSOR OF GENE SILENCING 3-like n=1 Tax=Macadamia integrifolia TaxID=60698 RepID=UPI001C4EF6D6|nr:protein SUPPRESSOR OF GENE SILENCING 3-like [Macadamia integrifolia]XP_042494173.1 protein SUPPRESSOR OF GENE SILENCING 3-like [Macadamia integrifolia]